MTKTVGEDQLYVCLYMALSEATVAQRALLFGLTSHTSQMSHSWNQGRWQGSSSPHPSSITSSETAGK